MYHLTADVTAAMDTLAVNAATSIKSSALFEIIHVATVHNKLSSPRASGDASLWSCSSLLNKKLKVWIEKENLSVAYSMLTSNGHCDRGVIVKFKSGI